MSDEMDVCGEIWGHEMTMRRLLTLLRQSQSSCSDIECFTEPVALDQQGVATADGLFMMICCIALAAFLFLFRPSSSRNRESEKPRNNQGNGGNPPPDSSTPI